MPRRIIHKANLRPTHFESGAILFKQGDSINKDIYMLNSGKIGVYIDEIEVAVITKKGTFVGESASLLGTERSATCVVLKDSICTVIPGSRIDKIIHDYPQIGLKLVMMFVERLDRTTNKFVELQKDLYELKKKLNQQSGISPKIADYDVLTQILLEMNYVHEEQVRTAKKKQKEYSNDGIEVPVASILVDMGAISVFEMIEGVKLQKILGDTNDAKS